jgi:hypothetical protein
MLPILGDERSQSGDYYKVGYNYTNFEGDNPRYNETMREISSYELDRMGAN